jgi:hypothetical protein
MNKPVLEKDFQEDVRMREERLRSVLMLIARMERQPAVEGIPIFSELITPSLDNGIREKLIFLMKKMVYE